MPALYFMSTHRRTACAKRLLFPNILINVGSDIIQPAQFIQVKDIHQEEGVIGGRGDERK